MPNLTGHVMRFANWCRAYDLHPISGWYFVGYFLVLIVGVVGFLGDPSPSILRLGQLPTFLWSLLYVVFGGAAFACRWKHYLASEAKAVEVLAGASVLWGAVILLAGLPSGRQAGLMLVAAGVFFHAWASSARSWIHREHIYRATVIAIANEGHV